jgi:hypothetical protein
MPRLSRQNTRGSRKTGDGRALAQSVALVLLVLRHPSRMSDAIASA